jgi:hypothetical protein
MTKRWIFEKVGGFDEQTFFMYCDDVDYSWLVREEGFRVVFQPAAIVFHDKQLSTGGSWMPTQAEVFFQAQAALLLAHKWSADDVLQRILSAYEGSPVEAESQAAAEFRSREAAGTLVAQHPREVASFVGSFYEKHRYPL